MNKNIIYMLVSVFLFLTYLQGITYASVFSLRGYIYSYKANNVGPTCFLKLSSLSTFNIPFQGGNWNCNGIEGQNILELAQLAYILNYPVNVTFDSSGGEYKEVYAISLHDK
ncbi:hypothetical protein [Serratia symbiotica]|uniref:hypothetical protein n=1 Tax=Serratia symbiotica TaxID=138074 RepID=UPI00135FBDFA|nr:hypothetical protein [Serratia symbiotica]MBQ0956603.1 hypothetical protein [Serratia symbiotica]